MYQPPSKDFEAETREDAPIRGLLIAVPIAIGLWVGIYGLVALFA